MIFIYLDQIAENISSVSEICFPNAESVNLNADCNFNVLYVPRQAVLTGSKITDPKRKIIFYKCDSNSFDIMDSEEFTNLYQSRSNIGEGVSSNVFKVPNPNIPNMFYALKVYKCRNSNLNNNDDDDEWGNNEEEDNNNNNDDALIDIDHMRYFFGEYEMLNLIHHPNIITAYSFFFGDQHNPPAILLEYCGHTLANSIRRLRNTD